MQPFAETERQFKGALIRGQDQDVARRIENGRADFAVFQVLLHLFLYLFGKRVIQIAGDVVPDVLAIYNHGNHLRFGFTCFN